MERNDYFKLCQRASYRRAHKRRPEWKPEELVSWNGGRYIPDKYLLGFDGNGGAIHTARLIDIEADSVCEVSLSEVERLCEAHTGSQSNED